MKKKMSTSVESSEYKLYVAYQKKKDADFAKICSKFSNKKLLIVDRLKSAPVNIYFSYSKD